MTYKTKRSLAQLGKHARNMPKLQHPDEAPTPSKQRCSHGYPVRRPPTRRRPRRTPPSAPPARPPSARPCAPSRPSSSWPTCTRCPWKTPTSTQRLPCSPPSLPPGCSMPDGLLDGDGFDGGLMLWLSGCPGWLHRLGGSKSPERAARVCGLESGARPVRLRAHPSPSQYLNSRSGGRK